MQGLGNDRLGQEVVHAGLETTLPVAFEIIGRHCDDGQGNPVRHGAQEARSLQAVHVRHLHIHQDQGVVVFAHCPYCGQTVHRDIDLQAGTAQQG